MHPYFSLNHTRITFTLSNGDNAYITANSTCMGTFVFNDENFKNSHGFKLRNSGGRFERFNKNPVLLYNHDTGKLIGQATNLRTNGTQYLFDDVYDEEDSFALECKRKVEKKFLRGASPGIQVFAMEWEEQPDGTSIPVATDWELCEMSIVPVPSHAGALKLYNESAEALTLEQIQLSISEQPNLQKMSVNIIKLSAAACTVLGLLAEAATEDAVSAAIVSLSARAIKAEQDLATYTQAAADAMVNEAVRLGKITAEEKTSYLELAKSNPNMCKSVLAKLPGKESLSAKVHTISGKDIKLSNTSAYAALSWDELDKKGLLVSLKQSNPDEFATKYKERFGRDYQE